MNEKVRMLTENQFEVLYLLNKEANLSQRDIAKKSGISLGLVNKVLKELRLLDMVDSDNRLTSIGAEKLSEYKVDNAIILAAGMSTRFVPLSYEFPKGLTVVKGEVLIERQIRQLHEAGIKEVVVVVGHMLEKFFYLKDKYDIKLIVNNDYKIKNTHSSIFAARDFLKNTYICCSDNYYPENLFRSHEYHAMYCAQFLDGESRTERGLITDKNGLIIATQKPCRDAWTMQGHAYFNRTFSITFKNILEDYYNKPGTDNLYWEGIYAENLDSLKMYMVKYTANDILEFDSVENLRQFDPDYIVHNDLKIVKNICNVLNTTPEKIRDINPIPQGMTNKSFSFTVDGQKYVYRNPCNNTIGYIDRKREKFALNIAKELGLDNSYIYEDEVSGWKISHYIEVSEPFKFGNQRHMNLLCKHLRSLHNSGIKCNSEFDYFVEADKLIERLKILDINTSEDIVAIRERVKKVNDNLSADCWPVQLSHNDIYEPNLLISGDQLNIIDWEYAGDTDIGYDLCKLFAVEDLPLEKIDDSLSVYYNRKPTHSEKKHIVGCAAVNYYYWYVWAVYQSRSGNECSDCQFLWYNKMNKYLDETFRLMQKE
ncbi:MAG: NTP transferase domain-containing protein [bacterium]|nr:NTP transferase domain-containing protein [bacterium]